MRLIVAVTGASGVEMGYHLLKALQSARDIDAGSVVSVETHLVVSEGAKLTWGEESSIPYDELLALADFVYDEHDLAAKISSGSFRTHGMIVIPCSMKTLAGIVTGYAENLIQRAADVCMKENRRVVLVPREMPFSKLHLRNMAAAADLGCAIVPPILTFYSGQETLQDQIDHVIGKVLMQFDLTFDRFHAWGGSQQK